MKKAVLASFALVLVAAAPYDLFRYSRTITASAGWARLVLPDDVLDACRPGLPDLRIRNAAGEEVAWALEERIGRAPARLPLRDVEKTARRETVALLDRGAHPALARAATLEIEGTEFLKPVSVESSDDGRSWGTFAKGSIFAGREVRSTTLRFPPNGRRWWRFRFDDRNGDPIMPRAVSIDARGEEPVLREISLAPGTADRSDPGATTRSVALPAGNLGVDALRISGAAPAYVRRVTVTSRVFYRDEVVRRVVGEGTISRAADGSGIDRVALCDGSARLLEIEIEEPGGPRFEIARVDALARPQAIVFAAPRDGQPLRLYYGSGIAEAPRYDLERALAIARPVRPSQVALGPAEKRAGEAAALPAGPRGAPVDPAAWKKSSPIALPGESSVAYLDLPSPAAEKAVSVRILDSEKRPVPYVMERVAHRERHPAPAAAAERGTKTIVRITMDPASSADLVEMSAGSPAYFSRQATVFQEDRDARGTTGRRVLGSASWIRREGDPPIPITIPITRPTQAAIEVEIENGDNAPLSISDTAVWTSSPRIDFAFVPGERLTLAWDNENAPAPRFDLELVAGRVLSAPALPAKLAASPAAAKPARAARTPAALWIAIVVGGALLLVVLARTLKSPG